ncbi:MAG: tetratricopeptide repeat protein [Planctomycetota bacterium]
MVRLAELLMEDWNLYDEAATILRWARELYPDETVPTRLLVEALTKSGQEDEARKLSNELPPSDDPDDLVTHALAQAAAFDHAKALELIDRAIALAPDEERLYARRGLIRFNNGNYDEAAQDLVRSLMVSWWTPTPDQDFEPLLRGFKKIRSEVPGDPLAFKVIDVWAKLSKKKPRAAKGLIAKLEGSHWTIDALRAAAAERRERAQAKYARAALAQAPDEVPLLIRLARLDRDDAAIHEKLVRLAPSWPDAHVDAAACYERLHDLDKALEHANAAVEKYPSAYNALKMRAEVLEKRGDLKGALTDLDELVELYDDEEEPDETDWDGELWREELNTLRCARARVRQKLRDLDGAKADLDLACSLSGSHSCWPFFDRARFYMVIGEREKALADLDRGLSKVEWPEALGMRARLREKMGDTEGAKKDKKRRDELMKMRQAARRRKPGKKKKK